MSPGELLDYLTAKGARLTAAGDRLRVDAPAGVITPEMRLAICTHKAQVLELVPFEFPVGWSRSAWRHHLRHMARVCMYPGPGSDVLRVGGWHRAPVRRRGGAQPVSTMGVQRASTCPVLGGRGRAGDGGYAGCRPAAPGRPGRKRGRLVAKGWAARGTPGGGWRGVRHDVDAVFAVTDMEILRWT
ncbi:MAG: hypothetical protein GY778_20190 [bacterium]|nr:hypothetical protein [bacterium]